MASITYNLTNETFECTKAIKCTSGCYVKIYNGDECICFNDIDKSKTIDQLFTLNGITWEEEAEGFAGGTGASTTTGGAIGNGAKSTDGFAGGDGAIATEKGAVQLGDGTNGTANSLQFQGTQIVKDGKIVSSNLNTVSVEQGGTGATTPEEARENLGITLDILGGTANSANKVNKSLTISLNGGTTEGTNKFTFDGSAEKSVNITKSNIGLDKVDNTADSNKTVKHASTADSATKATQDASGNVITSTYETKNDVTKKLTEVKTYADNAATSVKNDLLNNAGAAYDTLKELGDLIDENKDAIDALEEIAVGKADKTITATAEDDDVVVLTGTNGSNGVKYKATHANSGVSAGTYKSVTVDAKGHVTGGTNPTTLSGYGITDAYTKNEIGSTYETKTDATSKLSTAKTYTDTNISTHNTNTSAHNDIRLLIIDLTTKLNNFLDVDDITTDQLSELIALIKANAKDIETITNGKVNTSDIINNLTTNSANKVLSAAQGVAIKKLIDDLTVVVNGKANASHGTHVEYSTTAPVMDGTASAGSAGTVARSDHKHPTDTTRASQSDLTSHINNTSNPHGVTLSQLDVTATAEELNYTDGVVSNIQTQLNGKAPNSHNHDASAINSGTLSSDRLPIVPVEHGGTGATTEAGARENLKIAGRVCADESFPMSSYNLVAGIGAEIFNDYRERTYDVDHNILSGNVASGEYSHAEGMNTTATGKCAHAEGYNTDAITDFSHTEGYNTKTETDCAHAEGKDTTARGEGSHAEGIGTLTQHNAAHAEGKDTTASGLSAHAEGNGTTASGLSAHAEGVDTLARGSCSHSGGRSTMALGTDSYSDGYETRAIGDYSHASGYRSYAFGESSTAFGYGYQLFDTSLFYDDFYDANTLKLQGQDLYDYLINNYDNTKRYHVAYGDSSFCGGSYNLALGKNSFVFGEKSIVAGDNSFVFGKESIAAGKNSFVTGHCSWSEGDNSHAIGYNLYAQNCQVVVGKNNSTTHAGSTDPDDQSSDKSVFVVGTGTSSTASNGFRVTSAGNCYGTSAFIGSGADFPEFEEWDDGNPNNEDRRGLFVALNGDKIVLASSEKDHIIGVVSSMGAFIANGASENWHGMYLKDVFGKNLTQQVEIPEKAIEKKVIEKDEEGNEIEKTITEVIPAHTVTQFVVNPDYNPDEKYIGREFRKEWAPIGKLGQVIVVDDGTCTVGGYCKPSANGIGTAGEYGYYVRKRIDSTHIKVEISPGAFNK